MGVINLLQELSVPTISIVVLVATLFVLKELFNLLKGYNLKIAQLVLEKELQEMDNQLEEFYLPLTERFEITKTIFTTSSKWMREGKYDNKYFNIKSDDAESLRHILVREILIPLNKEICDLILNKLHLRHQDDTTDYTLIIQHYLLWHALESSKKNKFIDDYEALGKLEFPANEIESCNTFCTKFISQRAQLRDEIKRFRTI